MQLPPGITEQELVRQCKNGDLKHQEMLYKHFYGYAMGVGLRYSANRDDALEVVNDAFIKAFGDIENYRTDKPFKAWLRKIVVNTAIDKYRRDKKHLMNVELDNAVHIGSQASILQQLNANDILKMLDTLPPAYRMVFNLYEIDGYDHNEIAAMMGISASSSRVYLARAKEKLRSMLQEDKEHERRV
ncbi:RNA polymerase sigma factor [Mucilaginibacter sp. HMF5004]|uniref:RNA polymerase sigma factor n=1 Tax=Mucilaginibacter rivuli TaxID=2857527 RepID=UPI001C5FA954|nr:RNA polymerase sigma factor [Mucilaginibacter rivuli]MBW4891444.1 RNA polymerase sigma factor [Mucilaginibacter rivuli]